MAMIHRSVNENFPATTYCCMKLTQPAQNATCSAKAFAPRACPSKLQVHLRVMDPFGKCGLYYEIIKVFNAGSCFRYSVGYMPCMLLSSLPQTCSVNGIDQVVPDVEPEQGVVGLQGWAIFGSSVEPCLQGVKQTVL